MYSQPLVDAIAEAERLVTERPSSNPRPIFWRACSTSPAERRARTSPSTTTATIPFLHEDTGPFTKMGLDNPDTMYFGTRVQPSTIRRDRQARPHDRGELPADRRRVHRRESFPTRDRVRRPQLDIAADGTFEWRFPPDRPRS